MTGGPFAPAIKEYSVFPQLWGESTYAAPSIFSSHTWSAIVTMTPQQAMQTAMAAINSGDAIQAEAIGLALSRHFPDQAIAWKILARAIMMREDYIRAIPALRKAAQFDPADVQTWRGLAFANVQMGDWQGAYDAALEVVSREPRAVDGLNIAMLAIVSMPPGAGRKKTLIDTLLAHVPPAGTKTPKGALSALAGLDDSPNRRSLFRNLSAAFFDTGADGETVIEAFTRSTQDNPAAADRARLTEKYVGIAVDYDANALQNDIPERLVRFVLGLRPPKAPLRIVDAGCGTGLVGTHLKAQARRMVGIDLSPAMLARARAKGIYDDLVEDDMAAGLGRFDNQVDIIASSAAVYHIGDLAPLFAASTRALDAGGLLCFTVDPCSDAFDIRCTAGGDVPEFAHSRKYLRRLAAANGLDEVAIRLDRHRVYPGFYCAFIKP